jgi:hypothetical protein
MIAFIHLVGPIQPRGANLTFAATVSFEPKMAFGGVQVPPHQLNISVDACSADLPSIQALSFLACCRRACFCAATNE